MNSRVKTLFGLVVLGLFVFQFKSSLTQADELSWEMLKTPKIEIQAFSSGEGEVISSYPPFLQTLFRDVINWDPRKELNISTSPSIELLRNFSVDFDIADATHFRKVWFHLTPTLKVRGLFGLHDFKKPRPLIILRMGIHGNVDELFAERFIAKAVYEDLDANFLILENLTSHAFLSQNKEISFGGIEEGLHTFLILNYLMDQKYYLNQFTKDIHLIGVSLGAQGTFVTAQLDYYNQHRIKSILNFCPLINPKNTFNYHAHSGIKNAAVDLWNAHRMKTLFQTYSTQLADLSLWKEFFDWQPRFIPRILQILNSERSTPLLSVAEMNQQVPHVIWPEGFAELLTKSKSFDEMNDFWKLYRGVKTPMMIYTTPNDPLVINELNSEIIFSGKQPGDFQNLKYEKLTRGLHCGLAPVYSWSDVVKYIKEGLEIK